MHLLPCLPPQTPPGRRDHPCALCLLEEMAALMIYLIASSTGEMAPKPGFSPLKAGCEQGGINRTGSVELSVHSEDDFPPKLSSRPTFKR